MSEPLQHRSLNQQTIVDRRASQRYPFLGSAQLCDSAGTGPGEVVETHDISTIGISFSTDRQFKISQKGVLALRGESDFQEPRRLEFEVIWVVWNDMTRRCRVGGQWLQPLTESDLSRFS